MRNHTMNIKIAPSIMCFRAWELPEYIAVFEEVGADCIHFDVMDGHFVGNIMLGTSFYRDVTELTKLPIDIHLMCNEPERYVDYFKPREGDMVSFHPGTCAHPYRLLQRIRDMGCKSGLVLDPGTSVSWIEESKSVLDFVLVMAVNPGFAGQTMVPDHLDKVSRIAKLLDELALDADLFIDGNTTSENARKMYLAGANAFVVGTSSLLKSPQYCREQFANYKNTILGN